MPKTGVNATGMMASLALAFIHFLYPKEYLAAYFDSALAAGGSQVLTDRVAPDFSWDDLEAISRNASGNCGADKCFWRSTSEPESVGYLVASAGYHYRKMKRAFKFAKEILEGECNAKHFLMDPPVLVQNVSRDFLDQLNSLTDNPAIRIGLDNANKSQRSIFYVSDPSLVVQKVKVAPSPSLLFGYTQGKRQTMIKEIPTFREQVTVPLPLLEERLEAARKALRCAMDRKETYWWDIQGLVDVEGNYYHIDIDSHFWQEDKQRKRRKEAEKDGKGKKKKKEKKKKELTNNFQAQHDKIGLFNDMIQRLTQPPPVGYDELEYEKW
eukprot:CAMPEP_0178603506 /NCGR_PEP_ID=MMETSP0697-20121206/35549_1 /TAXON_ID=265572 /ORGANISM="Extubocellulus spinifer, Strain CCMP396" /LENGTH=324 /DNA_ID=CAMNT_0020241819 /DNA_START=38 /DNA_END=1009 /DNA_ORIENTATION=-